MIEEVAGVAEANARLMAAQRSGAPGALPAAERRRAADLYFNVAVSRGWWGGGMSCVCLCTRGWVGRGWVGRVKWVRDLALDAVL